MSKPTVLTTLFCTLVAAFVTALVLSGCDDTGCTQVGCSDSVNLSFTHDELGGWSISVDLIANGEVTKTLSCDGALTALRDEDKRCDSGLYASITFDEARTQQVLTGIAIDSFEQKPEEIVFRLTVNDELRKDAQIPLMYKDFRPNGSGCEPVCRTAEQSIDL